jgi:hypothetical protein
MDPDRYGPVVYGMANTDGASLSRLEEHITEKAAMAKEGSGGGVGSLL